MVRYVNEGEFAEQLKEEEELNSLIKENLAKVKIPEKKESK